MECEHCHKQYSSLSSLNHHKKTNKSCLLIRHNDKLRIIELEKILEEKNKELQMKNSIIQEKDEIIKDMAIKSTSTTTNITVNNKYTFLQTFNLSADYIKSQINTKFTEVHLLNGQKGVAIFTNQYLIRNEEGKPNYFCTDLNRRVFIYKNGEGFIQKDFKSVILTSLTMDNYRESQYVSNLADIKNLKNDNSTFVTTLAGLACNVTTLENGDIRCDIIDDSIDDSIDDEYDEESEELMRRFYEERERIRLSQSLPPQST